MINLVWAYFFINLEYITFNTIMFKKAPAEVLKTPKPTLICKIKSDHVLADA
jgi:hypothetical protein